MQNNMQKKMWNVCKICKNKYLPKKYADNIQNNMQNNISNMQNMTKNKQSNMHIICQKKCRKYAECAPKYAKDVNAIKYYSMSQI